MQLSEKLRILASLWTVPHKVFDKILGVEVEVQGADVISWADELDRQAAEIERLNGVVMYEQHRAGRQGTHGPGCHLWGPAHYECLAAELAAIQGIVDKWDGDTDHEGAAVAVILDELLTDVRDGWAQEAATERALRALSDNHGDLLTAEAERLRAVFAYVVTIKDHAARQDAARDFGKA